MEFDVSTRATWVASVSFLITAPFLRPRIRRIPMMRVAVIGAGPAGLTAAVQLQSGGAQVDVFEAGSSVGGLARSFRLWDQTVDLGPHRFFSQDTRVNRFWLDIIGDDYSMVNRKTRIHYDGKLLEYPLQPRDVSRKLGWTESARCIASYLRQQWPSRSQDPHAGSFESWVIHRFGRRLYETFFQSYSEKLWGIPCTELSDDFAAQRIRQLTLLQAIRSALAGNSSSHHRTLADQFAYPNQGTGHFYQRMADRFQAAGGTLRLEHRIRRVQVANQRVIGVEFDSSCNDPTQEHSSEYDHVISTMPLTQLVDQIDSLPSSARSAANSLGFRNTVLTYLHVDDSQVFPDQWLYIHSPQVRIGRVTNFRNWAPELYGDSNRTILCVESWCDQDDDTWNCDDDHLIQRTVSELREIDVLQEHPVLDGRVVRIPRCYPIYRIGYRDQVDQIADALNQLQGLTVIGRYGAFKYNNQDHSILTGLLAAENILHDAGHNLWNINSDFDAYQECSLIAETGLVHTDRNANPVTPILTQSPSPACLSAYHYPGLIAKREASR